MIVFVAEMRNPKTRASSTQIMTRNILYGFNKLDHNTVFVPVIEDESDIEDIEEYYAGLYRKIIFAFELSKHKRNVVLRQISWLINTYNTKRSIVPKELIDELKCVENEVVLVSQSPSIDTALLCKEVKKMMPSIRYIQYWGDPLALSLISPPEYNIKRSILKMIENKLHKSADRIVYGTESLYQAETELFPKLKDKASFCRVCYMPDAIDRQEGRSRILFGYYGNYYSNIRNIKPLYNAFVKNETVDLVICGSSDLHFSSTNNVKIENRIPQSEVEVQESKLDVEICILNSVGIQIPGKIFYHSKTSKLILVILDGPRKDEIRKELEKSNRFIFCDNNEDDIGKAIRDISSGIYSKHEFNYEYYSPSITCKEIIGV